MCAEHHVALHEGGDIRADSSDCSASVGRVCQPVCGLCAGQRQAAVVLSVYERQRDEELCCVAHLVGVDGDQRVCAAAADPEPSVWRRWGERDGDVPREVLVRHVFAHEGAAGQVGVAGCWGKIPAIHRGEAENDQEVHVELHRMSTFAETVLKDGNSRKERERERKRNI